MVENVLALFEILDSNGNSVLFDPQKPLLSKLSGNAPRNVHCVYHSGNKYDKIQ